MTALDLLTGALNISAVLSWIVTLILIRAAVQRPLILALALMGLLSFLVTAGLSAYVWAIANAALNFPVPREVAQIVLRVVFLGLFAFQVLFLVAYRRGWFKDAGS